MLNFGLDTRKTKVYKFQLGCARGVRKGGLMTTEIEIKKIGENFVLPLTQELLEALEIQNGGKVEVTISEKQAVMRPLQKDERRKLFEKYKAQIFEEHREVLQALAEGAK